MAFTKIAAAGIGSTETVTLHSLEVLNNATVGGVLTYEDVTNVDSIGIITARAGVLVGSGITLSKDGDIFATGVTTSTTFSGSGASLTNLPSAQLTGALPALDGSALTGVASTENIRTNTNATFLQNINVSGTTTTAGLTNTIASGNVIALMDSSNNAQNHRVRINSQGSSSTTSLAISNSNSNNQTSFVHENGSALSIRNGQTAGSEPTSGSERLRIEPAGDVKVSQNLSVTGIVTAQSFVPTVGQFSHRNIVINGAMAVAQRGTSSAGGEGYKTVDRFQYYKSGTNETPNQAQVDVAAGTTPYTLGFRKAYQVENGNQSSAGGSDLVFIETNLEAQDIANSGWNYLSSSSYITLSFWVKSSVAQNFYGYLLTVDGTAYKYPFETGSLSANTWTKVTKTIPGNSNLQFDNDSNKGLGIVWWPFLGDGYTDSGVSLDTWATWSSGTRTPDATNTWYLTNDATFQITGVQLEVGPVATPFEHRSFGEELARCQRYLFKNINESGENGCNYAKAYSTSELFASVRFPVAMRATPTVTAYGNQGSGGTVHKLGGLPDKSYTSIDRLDVYGGMRLNSSAQWATGDTDMYSFTFQAEAEI